MSDHHVYFLLVGHNNFLSVTNSCLSQLPVCHNFLSVTTSGDSQLVTEKTQVMFRHIHPPLPASPSTNTGYIRVPMQNPIPLSTWPLLCPLFLCYPKFQHATLMLEHCSVEPSAVKCFEVSNGVEKD